MSKLIIGCGYLGRRVAELWHEHGHSVYATTRNNERAKEFRRLKWTPVICDVLDPNCLRSLPKVDTVVYSVGFDRAAGVSMRRVYVDGLSNVLDHLPKPKRFIHVSSTGVYGQQNGEIVDESSETNPAGESGQVVLDAEKLLRAKMPSAVILRFAGIYGPGRGFRKKEIAAGEPIQTNPDKWLNLIHADDGASVILAAQEHAEPGETYNVCDDQPVQRRDFYERMAEIMKAPPPRFDPPEEPTSDRERANRRIDNRKMKEILRVELMFPSFAKGLQ